MVFRFILVLDYFFSSKMMRPSKYVNVLIIRQLFSYILTFLRVCIVCVYIQLQSIAIRSISTINRFFFYHGDGILHRNWCCFSITHQRNYFGMQPLQQRFWEFYRIFTTRSRTSTAVVATIFGNLRRHL